MPRSGRTFYGLGERLALDRDWREWFALWQEPRRRLDFADYPGFEQAVLQRSVRDLLPCQVGLGLGP
jgi:hypothetical protein